MTPVSLAVVDVFSREGGVSASMRRMNLQPTLSVPKPVTLVHCRSVVCATQFRVS